MGTETGLTFGAQTVAAGCVRDSCGVLEGKLEVFSGDVEAHLPGVTNGGTSTLVDAVSTWGEAFGVFFEGLQAYASALAAVDETTTAVEEQAQSSFANSDLAARMGGW